MKLSFDKKFLVFYLFSFTLLISILAGGGFYFYEKGLFNIEHIGESYEASLNLNEIQRRTPLEKINYYVSSDRAKDAIHEIDYLRKNVIKINRVVGKSDEKLMDSLLLVEKDVQNLLIHNEVTSVFIILKKRIESFEVFVVENSWKTLTRISDRLLSNFVSEKMRRPGFFEVSNLSPLIRTITRSISSMKAITLGSVLLQSDKDLIVKRLTRMNVEVKMLQKYLKDLKAYRTHFQAGKSDFVKWKKEISPKLTLNELSQSENAKQFVLGGLSLIALVIFLMFTGGWVANLSHKKNCVQTEKLIINIIQDGLLPITGKVPENITANFENEFQKMREYLHKRMSFGKLFQEAVPFSSILLDSNLNVVWGNDLFFDSWGLKTLKEKNEQVTWDYLLQYTNLGTQDPVIDALKSNIAGIYDIQIKYKSQDSRPYEMYVSPVDYLGQKRIMIFFYPLQSLEDTLANQTQAIISPISKTIAAMIDDEFDSEFKENILKDFSVAGITSIYDEFVGFNSHHLAIYKNQNEEIAKINKKLTDRVEQINETRELLQEKEGILREMMGELKSLREIIVQYVGTSNEFNNLFIGLTKVQKLIGNQFQMLVMQGDELNNALEDNKNAFIQVSNIKPDFQHIIKNTNSFRTELVQKVDQAIVENKNNKMDTMRVHEVFLDLKKEIKSIDTLIHRFTKLSTKLDVGLSKVQMLLDGTDRVEVKDSKSVVSNLFIELDEFTRNGGNFHNDQELKEEDVISSIKDFYSIFKNVLSNHKELKFMISESEDKKEELQPEDILIQSSEDHQVSAEA